MKRKDIYIVVTLLRVIDTFPYRFSRDIGLSRVLANSFGSWTSCHVDHRSSSYHFFPFCYIISYHFISTESYISRVVMHIHKSSILIVFHNYRLPYIFHITIIVYFIIYLFVWAADTCFALTVILASSVSICVFPYVFSLPN